MYYVYILTNKTHSVLYIGVTNDLKRRIYEHKNGVLEGFTKNYHVNQLMYYEIFYDPRNAILREKQIKGWRREKKNALIETKNPDWIDYWEKL